MLVRWVDGGATDLRVCGDQVSPWRRSSRHSASRAIDATGHDLSGEGVQFRIRNAPRWRPMPSCGIGGRTINASPLFVPMRVSLGASAPCPPHTCTTRNRGRSSSRRCLVAHRAGPRSAPQGEQQQRFAHLVPTGELYAMLHGRPPLQTHQVTVILEGDDGRRRMGLEGHSDRRCPRGHVELLHHRQVGGLASDHGFEHGLRCRSPTPHAPNTAANSRLADRAVCPSGSRCYPAW